MNKAIITSLFQKQNVHFVVLLACIAMQMFSVGGLYRLFAYLNLLIVIATIYHLSKLSDRKKHGLLSVDTITFYPLAFCLLHFISQQEIVLLKEMRHILLAVFLAIGTACLYRKSHSFIKEHIGWIAILTVAIYVVSQAVAIFVFESPYGTSKNPHYLALYMSVSLMISIYFFFKDNAQIKPLLIVLVLMEVYFLLKTGSRPTWIGLLLSALLIITFFIDRQLKLKALIGLSMIILVITLTNVGGFTDRAADLINNVRTEERVTIWQDVWNMQINSSKTEWVFGHGIDAFEDDFKTYSQYHLQGVDFNSPHNYFLEILYISGVIGIGLFVLLIITIYKQIIHGIFHNREFKVEYLLLFSIFTSTFLMASITLPIFYSYTMNIIAYVIGIIVYLKKINNKV